MICHCFTLDQQHKVTKLKYIANEGCTILNEADLDNIINAVAGADIYDTTLGLSDKEQQISTTSKGYDASAIMFGGQRKELLRPTTFLLKPPPSRSIPKTWMTVWQWPQKEC
jgi:hypothetical protein